MDKIRISDLKIFARHGVFDFENERGQNFYVCADIYLDAERAGLTDDLEASVDYGAVCRVIEKATTEKTYKLIEAAAQNVALAVLKSSPLIERVDIEFKKPEAPIDMEFGCVSVKISRSWNKAVIALGSNMGDSRAIIAEAVEKLRASEYIEDVRASSLMVTKPYGYTEQDDFLNGALVCRTALSPRGLLDLLHDIENEAGRKREIRWGPRTLDLDIIFYGSRIISEPDLTIPHIDMQNRLFVLEPVAELVPDYVHPKLGATVKELLERLKNE